MATPRSNGKRTSAGVAEVVRSSSFLVCDLEDPACAQAKTKLESVGFDLRVRNVKEYQGLDFHSPHLFAGEYTIAGLAAIREFADRFGLTRS